MQLDVADLHQRAVATDQLVQPGSLGLSGLELVGKKPQLARVACLAVRGRERQQDHNGPVSFWEAV